MEAWLFATAFCALLATFVLSQPATLSRLEKNQKDLSDRLFKMEMRYICGGIEASGKETAIPDLLPLEKGSPRKSPKEYVREPTKESA